MSSGEIIVRAERLTKSFKLYPHPRDRMIEWLTAGRRKRHSDFVALRDVSFEVGRGECFGVIGQNGAGKSTLLKILSGVMSPTEGSFHVEGRALSLLELGTGFSGELTGRQNVINSAHLLGFPKGYLTKEKMRDIEEFADIGEYFDRPVKMYSSGMFVRLAFGMFIFMEPDVFIIDEALSVGDVFFQQRCFTMLRKLIAGGTTLLFVSHDLQAVQNLSDRAALLERGKIMHIGPPEETVSKYYARLGESGVANRGETRPRRRSGGENRPVNVGAPVMDPESVRAHSILNGKPGWGNGAMKILAARVIDERGEDTLAVNLLGELNFFLLIRAARDVVSPHAGVALYDRMNNLIFSSTTEHLGVVLPDLGEGEELVVGFRLTMNIQPGEYTFSLALGEPLDESSPNIGRICDKHDSLGPLSVVFDYSRMAPFNGITKLPMEVII